MLTIVSHRFSRGCRPLSAPPGKHNLLDSNSPLPPPDSPRVALPPDSPRVIEVVEKSESVSWKLEYQEGEPAFPLLSSSPGTPGGRKISPQSPLALRRVVSAGLMTRCAKRNNEISLLKFFENKNFKQVTWSAGWDRRSREKQLLQRGHLRLKNPSHCAEVPRPSYPYLDWNF